MLWGTRAYEEVRQEDGGLEASREDVSVGLESAGAPGLPNEPPAYGEAVENETYMQPMGFYEEGSLRPVSRFRTFQANFKSKFVLPVREKIIDPLVEVCHLLPEYMDFYLNKVGNPFILRRFVYIFFMSLIAYYASVSGVFRLNKNAGRRGMFYDQYQLMQYATNCIDYAKMESDLEYLSSMPHIAGTKGDYAIMEYVLKSFKKNNLELLTEKTFTTFLNYPGGCSVKAYDGDSELFELELDESNFNPMTPAGEVKGASLVYAHYGSTDDFKKLQEAGLVDENTVLIMHYGKSTADQVLRAQNYGAKAILFVTEPFDGNADVVQTRHVGLSQIGTGDVLTPGWSANNPKKTGKESSEMMPKIPTIPISTKQAAKFLELLRSDAPALHFENGWTSGVLGHIRVDFAVAPIEKDSQATWNIIGKIEGREQSDKAIIMAAARDSASYGALYPNFGQMLLLTIAEILQQLRYKFEWEPLRSIYFLSYDGSMYNSIGATELLESQRFGFQQDVYAVLDISQLGLNPNGEHALDIQVSPLFHDLFEKIGDNYGFNLEVRDVQQYGDWLPFMANGIPVAVLSSPYLLDWKPPLLTSQDTFQHISETFLQQNDGWNTSGKIVSFLIEKILKLIDDPLIPLNLLTYVDRIKTHLEELHKATDGKLDLDPIIRGLVLWNAAGTKWMGWAHNWRNILISNKEGMEPSLWLLGMWSWNKKVASITTAHLLPMRRSLWDFYKDSVFGPPRCQADDSAAHWTFPTVWDAICDNNWQAAQEQVALVGRILTRAAASFLEDNSDS